MNFLITGIAGFIGSSLAKTILEKGNAVVGIDNLSTGFEENIPEGAIFIKGNCQDPSVIQKLEKYSIDYVIHIAGQSSGEISYEDPVYDLQTNTQSTLLLLDFARKQNCKHFIYTSSMSVYGDVPDIPINEKHSCDPKSFYAIGKLASEFYIKRFSEQYQLPSSTLRLFNIYGPGQNMENMKQGMVSIFLAQALKDGSITVKGSPERFRDFVFIDDLIKVFLEVIKSIPENYTCYNVCSGVKTEVREIISILQQNIKPSPIVNFSGNTPGDQFGIYGDPSRMNSKLGIKLDTPFKVGFEKMLSFYKDKNE